VSAYFDQTHIQQILQAVNIVDVVSSYVALKPKGKETVGLCPFHDDKRPSLNVNAGKQIFKCFACGAGGDVIKFMMLREKLTFSESVRLLAERAGIKLPQRRKEAGPKVDRNELEKVNRWAGGYYRTLYESEEGIRARKYLFDREISEESARRFGLGWAGGGWDNLVKAAQKDNQPLDHLIQLGLVIEKEQGGYYDRFRERLIFPVIDAMGRVIAFGGRTLGDDAAKYINSPESVLFDKSRALYGIQAAKDAIAKERTAVVVEGYTDCLMAHQQGLNNVVATLGTALTTEHARILSRYADRIVLVFDSDAAGQKAADRAIEIFFAQQIEVRLVSLPKGKDPCDYLLESGKESFLRLLEGATEALEYKWQATLRRLEQADTVNGRKRAVEEFLQLLAQAFRGGGMEAIGRGLVLNQVAKLVEQPSEQVHKRMVQLARRLGGQTGSGRGQPMEGQLHLAPDSYTNSVRQILEVLLNRPEMFETVEEVIPDPKEITDPILGPIAEHVWEYCRQGGRGSLAEIMAGIESTELSRIVTDMALAGEKRGNYEQDITAALADIGRVRLGRERQELREQASSVAEEYGEAAQTALLLDIQSKIREDGKKFPRFR